MAGVRDIGSLDSDRGFVSSLASGVTSVANVANTVVDAFKDRVQAIYPGTVWCGDGHAAAARSGELGLFFFTDTCCRQHDACKIYIRAGETKYGLTNTGLFTRSHCSCDMKFRDCLRRTNSLVSAQIGLTYFNVLGPQCFRKAHPIVKCVRRTRITSQKCEEYELDYTKPKMWQWFDSETF
uniref:Phospholipase A2 n=2 Tax=Papilio polytes TaxID=76194 RepID=I4DR12_PAPPL|nr:simila to CG3009 [Papilio polytes]